MSEGLDLGSGHRLTWWSRLGSDERAGVIVYHPLHPDDEVCAWRGECHGSVAFDLPANAGLGGDRWQVESLDPLTLSPSLACHCGDHGYIRGGRWVPA